MNRWRFVFFNLTLLCFLSTACTGVSEDGEVAESSPGLPSPADSFNMRADPSSSEVGYTAPTLMTSWHIQYTGDLDDALEVDLYNLDLFETDAELFFNLKHRGVFVMCYFSAGSYEDWRPDAGSFPEEVLGHAMEGWPGETWLDIRRLDLLGPIMESRIDLARQKGCDGVDPDNVNGYTNDSGFPLSYNDQLAFNRFLSEAAHQRGLSIGLKNDLEQIPDLVGNFDWILNESCFYYDECEMLLPFIEAGKPVFVIEYQIPPDEFCNGAKQMGFNAIFKNWNLDEFSVSCG